MKYLTQREVEVLKYLSLGYTIKQIALNLFLSIETVRSHKKSIYRKLDISNGIQLGMWIDRNINNKLSAVA